MQDLTGILTNIQHYSIHDGPGIRSTAFFKGCNLICPWCHNPETQMGHAEIMVYPAKCSGCGACIAACPNGARLPTQAVPEYNRDKCKRCGRCAEICYSEAIQISGQQYTVDQLMDILKADLPFYIRSGGGVTFSGGEPLLQPDFLHAMLESCAEMGIHTAVDTAACVPWSALEKIAGVANLILLDLKTMNPERHRAVIGSDNSHVLDNAQRLSAAGVELWIRIPVIPGFNDTAQDMREISSFVATLKTVKRIDLMAFHQVGCGKYTALGKTYLMQNTPEPTGAHLGELADILRMTGIETHCATA